MKYTTKIPMVFIIALGLGLAGLVMAATSVSLGTADNFAVLAGSTITNTGPSVVNGDLGLSPGTSVTGFPPGTLNGTQYVANATAVQAKNDLTTAYNNAAGQTPVSTVPTELGGTTKTAGAYDSAAGTFGITGTLRLDAQGDPNAVFIFKTASTLITAGNSNVVLANGAQACNVFWQVGSSATLGINSTFKGNILALISATLTTGANVEGRVLARNGAVTLDTNTVTKATCAVPPTQAGHIIVEKQTDPDGSQDSFEFDPSWGSNFNLSDGDQENSGGLAPGTYSVAELDQLGWDLTSAICSDQSDPSSISLQAGETVTCVFTNIEVPDEKECVVGDVTVENDNEATVHNEVVAVANTGGNDAGGSYGGNGGRGGDIRNSGDDVDDSTTGNGGNGGSGDVGGTIYTGNANANAGAINDVNSNDTEVSRCGECGECGGCGDVVVMNRNRAGVFNGVLAIANTGDNSADGSSGGEGGNGGDIDNNGDDVDDSTTGDGGTGGQGGPGALIQTGHANANAGVINVVNRNVTRILR